MSTRDAMMLPTPDTSGTKREIADRKGAVGTARLVGKILRIIETVIVAALAFSTVSKWR